MLELLPYATDDDVDGAECFIFVVLSEFIESLLNSISLDTIFDVRLVKVPLLPS